MTKKGVVAALSDFVKTWYIPMFLRVLKLYFRKKITFGLPTVSTTSTNFTKFCQKLLSAPGNKLFSFKMNVNIFFTRLPKGCGPRKR